MTPSSAPASASGPHAPSARLEQLTAWLRTLADHYGLDLATLAPASADASFRRYFRLAARGDAWFGASGASGASAGSASPAASARSAAQAPGAAATVIAVDAPPPEKCREFVQVAGLLEAAGVHVPRVLEADFDAGFMLVTDLGTKPYLTALNEGDARRLMRDALDALIRWQSSTREGVLPPFDEAFMRREMELMPEWFITRHLGGEVDTATRGVLDRTFALLVASARAQPQVFMLRDFMPRNLMIAQPNPGVLDFQDAVLGPITYDVASLLRDAFLSWDEPFELDCFAYYWEHAKKAGLPVDPDFGEFYRQLEWMGLQRHIKVLGLFCRINYRDGKPHYLGDLARFIGYARKVAQRYAPLAPFARLLDDLEGRAAEVGYTF
ncbi:aminoglycoside phosphotransferase family protein [Paraburkholderia solisilvae]|uniref:N-acetylmuramate/N-acetylglucosamine kinase n=1 Tax=Paraburkholderia solisilvae TaxID=624376 RepID=A0A6J5DAC1_9BURK|nr:phosphotransferase [Paraburkholderia solisilvae]CAB3750863.1 N-acetylmuramate/N-acetylglucosamine kinase [Paraburkholderia solisilvae]